MKPFVSVLMLSYNNIAYLKKAVDSVLNQTHENLELVIGDDGSTDGSWELAERLAQKNQRIKAFQNEKRLGIVKNRHATFLKTSGEYICHLDGDDELYPYSIQTMLEHMQDEDVALGVSDNAWIDSSSKVTGYCVNKEPSGNLSETGWRHFGMYKRWAYDQTDGYNTKIIHACEDGDLFMQIADKFKCVKVPVVLYKYRCHDKNTSHESKGGKCGECNERPVCNFVRIWSKHAKYDPITFTPLKEQA